MTQAALTASLELAAERLGDPAPLIYARLFEVFPEVEEMFVMDTDGGVRGHMLAQAFDCLIDLSGEGHHARLMMQAEHATHDGIGIDPEIFTQFFYITHHTLKAELGSEWTDEFDAAWREVLARADAIYADIA